MTLVLPSSSTTTTLSAATWRAKRVRHFFAPVVMTSAHFEIVHMLFECAFLAISIFNVVTVIIVALIFAAVFYAFIDIVVKILADDVASYSNKDMIVYEQWSRWLILQSRYYFFSIFFIIILFYLQSVLYLVSFAFSFDHSTLNEYLMHFFFQLYVRWNLHVRQNSEQKCLIMRLTCRDKVKEVLDF